MSEDLNLSASYMPMDYNISINSGNGGTISSVKDENNEDVTKFYHDANYTVTITPDKFYKFKEWSSNTMTNNFPVEISAGSQIWQFSPDANTTYTAEFELIENYLFITKGVGAQSVLPESGMFNAINGNITVSATAMDGYEFSHWSDPYGLLSDLNESSTEANVSKIEIDAEITANFKVIDYTLDEINISSLAGGTYMLENPTSGKFQHFGQYSLTAVPNHGYKFDRWIGDGNTTNLINSPSSENNFLSINGPIQLTASFVPVEYELVTTSSPTDGGNVFGGGGFSILDSLYVEAQPHPFWNFDRWTGDIDYLISPNSASSSIEWPSNTAPRDLNFTAHFNQQQFIVEATHAGNGSLNYSVKRNDIIIQSGTALSDVNTSIYLEDQVFIEAVANDGWEFNYWIGIPLHDELLSYSTLDPYLEVVEVSPSSDLNLTANFTRQEYDLLISDLTSGGSSSGSGTYEFEELVEISAISNPHFIFTEWSGPDAQYLLSPTNSADNSLQIPSHDLEIFASFHPLVYLLDSSSGENGNVSFEATYGDLIHSGNEINATSRVVLTAHPDPGYVIHSWSWEKSDGS